MHFSFKLQVIIYTLSTNAHKLVKIFFEYGEEKYSRTIARKIVDNRKNKEIKTTFELVDCIKSAMPKNALNEKQHPAKRVFQAIRIEVNGELINLSQGIKDAVKCLKPGGRMLVITFHSLEDRIVKNFLRSGNLEGTIEKDFYGNILTPFKVLEKGLTASEEEVERNPRARSEKLRVAEKL